MVTLKFNNRPLAETREIINDKAEICELKNKLNAIMEYASLKVEQVDDHQYEVIKDVEQPSGDFLNPIKLDENGLEVVKGLFYYVEDKDEPHEAIVDAFCTSEDFYDVTWFSWVM